MNTKNNKRFLDMDRKLKTTMLELLKTTDFEKITVTSICDNAHVNRTTFYAHYTDIYEIMEQMEEHLNKELLESYSNSPQGNGSISSEWPFILFLRHIKKYAYFYRAALKQRRDFPLKQEFEPIWDQIIKPKYAAAGITSESEMLYYFVFFQAGFTMVLKRWVDTGCQESEEAIAQTIKNCVPAVWNMAS